MISVSKKDAGHDIHRRPTSLVSTVNLQKRVKLPPPGGIILQLLSSYFADVSNAFSLATEHNYVLV
jgi:hypothetical protein